MSLPGCITALATPFSGAGTLDQDAWRGLLNLQLRGGVQGVVVAGLPREAVALSDDPSRALTCEAVPLVEGAMPVVAGTGPMNTTGTIARTRSGPPLAGGVAPAVRLAPRGDPAAASAWDAQLAEFRAVFGIGSNPVPVKELLRRLGSGQGLRQRRAARGPTSTV